jgi:hypothetical protein
LAHLKEISRIAYDLRESLDLRVLRLEWPERLGWSRTFPVIDLQASVSLPDFQGKPRCWIGRGSASSTQEALNQAVGEAFERAAQHHFRNTRAFCKSEDWGGFALHSDPSLALLNAQNECLERDVFFKHFLTKTPLGHEPLRSELSSEYQEAVEVLGRSSVRIHLRTLSLKEGKAFALVCADGRKALRPFGARLGMACGDEFHSVIRKALFECCRMVAYQLDGSQECEVDPEDPRELHHLWAADPRSWAAMAPLLESSNAAEEKRKGNLLVPSTLDLKRLDFPCPWNHTLGLTVAGARHKDAIATFFGPTDLAATQLQMQLSLFLGETPQLSTLQTLLHPLA